MKSRKKTRQPQAARRPGKSPTADAGMTPEEKESLIDQVEEFEGPDRREQRGTPAPRPHEPGFARS